MKRIFSIFLVVALMIAGISVLQINQANAKTLSSAKGENIFVYAANPDSPAVLIKVLKLDELKALAHGQKSGQNYYISSTDNYPTTQYCEARGITVPELLAYVKTVTNVAGAETLTFSGGDTIRLMATDSYGNYNRSWTYDTLYGTPRYYFEGLFGAWKTAWEVSASDAKTALTLAEYNSAYRDSDPFYKDKLAVFSGGVKTEPILATESFSGRTTTDTLIASTEIGISDYIARNGGTVAGSLKDDMTDATVLRLALPMTETDLFVSNRTAFDNFKWIYNIQFVGKSSVRPLGTVAEPAVSANVSGDTLTFTVSCGTDGASIYYSFDGAPQIPYNAPVAVNTAGRDLAKDPVTFYVTAVREGYSDAGIISVKYPGLAPSFKTVYSAMSGTDVVFAPAESVKSADWSAWTGKLQFVTIKKPNSHGYVKVEPSKYTVTELEFRINSSEFTEFGAYSVIFHSAGYADKSTSITVKQAAPDIRLAEPAAAGEPLTFMFGDENYRAGTALYVTPPDGKQIMLTSSKIDTYIPELPGDYIFSFVNNKYEPGAVEVAVTIPDGGAPFVTRGEFIEHYFPAGELRGYEDGSLRLESPITLGQIAIVLSRANGITETEAWGWAVKQGYFNQSANLKAYITQDEITQILEKYNADRTT
jgi:hypothetical protein